MPPINRRDFLKLIGLVPLGLASPRLTRYLGTPQGLQQDKQNVIVVVFDALSALNVSLYKYPRETMPHLAKLAQRAIVYHNHFAGGCFTTPGTASLLTGTLPWTHRAIKFHGKVAESFVERNIFHLFPNHYRLAYSHNWLVNILLEQFGADLDALIPEDKLFLTNDGFLSTLFKHDKDIATVGWARNVKKKGEGFAYSLFLSALYEPLHDGRVENIKPLFPRGIPNVSGDNYFVLEQAIDSIAGQLATLSQPFLGYFHFLPPHFPYNTPKEFCGRFGDDNLTPVEKPLDLFSLEKVGKNLLMKRAEYDEFILYADREFARFYAHLEKAGLLENTWIVLTSDHGEMFERGINGHLTPVLYQPVIRTPLLIFEPGRKNRVDIHTPTSAMDVLPTLLQVTGQKIPDWVEGSVLPPFVPAPVPPNRNLYVVQAMDNPQLEPLTKATVAMLKGRYKLIYYLGYRRLMNDKGVEELIQLYDLEADPEELNDLADSQKGIAMELFNELKAKLAEVNQPYL